MPMKSVGTALCDLRLRRAEPASLGLESGNPGHPASAKGLYGGRPARGSHIEHKPAPVVLYSAID